MAFTHSDLCQIAARWLKNSCKERCPVVFTEIVTQASETPDVIGFNATHSVMIEVKVSRSDFLADRKKFQRIFPEMGVGDFRFYCCPENLIRVDEVPEKWGLIWVNAKGRCVVVKDVFVGNINSASSNRFLKKYELAERQIMYSALRRQQRAA